MDTARITIGEILSGVYEKSATAITTMAEGVVSLAEILIFFTILITAYDLNLVLLPSVFAGAFWLLSSRCTRCVCFPTEFSGISSRATRSLAGILFPKML